MKPARPSPRTRTALRIAVPLAILAVLIALARRDRAGRVRPPAAAGRETLVAAVPEAATAAAAAKDDALADIRDAEERLKRTREELEGVRTEIEARQRELERVRDDADADARRSREELERARKDLEKQQGELEEAARDADRRLREARKGMEDMERRRRAHLEAAAGAGVARGLDAGLPPGLDPRAMPRGAVPTMPPAGLADGGLRPPTPPDRMTAAELFFERRRINRLARAAEARPRPTMEQIVRAAAAAAPPRLDGTQFDRTTGDIAWPAPLTEDRYAAWTADVDRRFRERASWGGGRGPEDDAALVAAIDALVAQLKENVSRHPGGKYGRARTFLDSLRSEAERGSDD